jgi:hypothetical protein
VANSSDQAKLFLDAGGLDIMHQIYATDIFPVTHLIQSAMSNQLAPVLQLFAALAMRYPAQVLEATVSAATKCLGNLNGMLPPLNVPLVSLIPEAGKWPTLLRAVSTANAHLSMMTHLLRELNNNNGSPVAVDYGTIHRRLLWELSTNRYQGIFPHRQYGSHSHSVSQRNVRKRLQLRRRPSGMRCLSISVRASTTRT